MFIKVYSSSKIPHIINLQSISTIRAEDKYWIYFGETYPCGVRITFMNSEKELFIVKDSFEEACEEVERINTFMEEYRMDDIFILYDYTDCSISINNRRYSYKPKITNRKELVHIILNDFPNLSEDDFDEIYSFLINCYNNA